MKMKHKLLSLLGILALTAAFFSCSSQVNYTVAYLSEYGTAPDAISVEENTTLSETQLPILYADNAVFEGWYDGETKAVAGVYQVRGTVTLTAHWVFSVTYSSEHGIVPETITVEKNTILTETQLPTLSDGDGTLVFKGWFDNRWNKAVAGEYHVTENVTLTALWAPTVTVSYHSKFGTVPESFDVEYVHFLTKENLTDISCSPYTFLGWYYEKDEDNNGTGTQAQVWDKITADTPLYAKWETATVSFRTEFGTVPSIKKCTGEKISEDEIPNLEARTGYSLDGWFIGSTKLTTDYTVTGDVWFTEKWTANNYTITFKANGGSGNDCTQTVTFGTTAKLTANSFTRDDGYAFDGWNISADGNGTSYADEGDFAVTETNNVTLYAQWTPMADENTIVDMIRGMKQSGTIAAKGTFSTALIRKINSALKGLPGNVYVFLDLSNVTGLTKLEDATVDGRFREGYSFYECEKLSGIILPNSVTSIGDYAFEGCSGLTGSLTIPDGVTSIGDGAFRHCSGLTSLTIPDSVTSIGSWAFVGCSGLTSVTIPDSVTSFAGDFFAYCSSLTSVTMPDGVTSICFRGCSSLTSVTLPSSVIALQDNAFYECSSLTSITIPAGVKRIGMYAFINCSNLASVTFIDTKSIWYQTDDEKCRYAQGTLGAMSNPSDNASKLTEYYYRYLYRGGN